MANQPVNTLPAANSSFLSQAQTYWRDELPAVVSRFVDSGWVISGGLHATAGGMTSAAFATEAFTPLGVRLTADGVGGTVAINYSTQGAAATDTVWVIISNQSGSSIAATNFTRVGSSHYFTDAVSASQPTLPSDSAWLMRVTISGSAITAITDLRRPASFARHGVYDVTDALYGAVGDGSTDDQAACNLATAAVQGYGGGVVYFPGPATYYITTSIKIYDNTLVRGDGPSSIIKMGSAQTTCALINSGQPTSASNSNIAITDLAIDGNRATPAGSFTNYEANIWNNSTAYGLGTYVANSTAGFRIYKVITAGTTSGAGTGPTSTASDITDGTCHFQYVEDLWTSTSDPTGHQAPILLSRVTNCLVDNVLMSMSRDNGAIFELCQGAKITNCHLRDINKNGVYFSDNEHSVCSGNTVEYSYGGFAFACEWYSALTDNVGRSCLNYLISLGRDAQYCTITGNAAGRTASGSGGLGADGDLLVTAESITGTTHGKTYAGSSGDYYYGISHSVIANNDVTRLQLQFSDGNIVAHNVIQNARRDGLHLLGCSQNLLIGNKVYNGGSTTLGPWAYANLQSSGGALQGTIQSVQNRWLYNEVHDDRDNDGTVRWGFTFTGSPAYLHLKGNMVALDDTVALAARFYNWNVDFGVFEDNYWNGTKKFLLAGLPTAREELRGDLFTVNGGTGVLDLHYICQKTAADAYEFKRLTTFVPKGSFTITGTGFTANPTATAVYEVVEDVVQLYIPQLSATSNATSFTLTGMDAALTPSRTRWLPVRIADNGTDAFGLLLVTASSTTLTLYPTAQSGSLWTNSGTKTLYAVLVSWTIGSF